MRVRVFYFTLILFALCAVDAYACSCMKQSEEQKYLNASEIFIGTVVETILFTETKTLDEQEISTEYVRAKIRINKTIKGVPSQHKEVLDSVADGANCAVGLFTGREYLFYLHGNNLLSLCGGTRLYNEFSDQDLIEELLSY